MTAFPPSWYVRWDTAAAVLQIVIALVLLLIFAGTVELIGRAIWKRLSRKQTKPTPENIA